MKIHQSIPSSTLHAYCVNFLLLLLTLFTLTSSAQQYEWVKRIGGSGFPFECPGIVNDSLGNIYIAGHFKGSLDFDPGAGTLGLSSPSSANIFIAKYTKEGNVIWAKGIGGSGDDKAYAIALDKTGGVLVCGSFSNSFDFDPGAGVATVTNAGTNVDAFVSKFDTSGNFVWVKTFGNGAVPEEGYSIAADDSGNVYTTGYFTAAVLDINPSAATNNINATGGRSVFIQKLNNNGDFMWGKAIGGKDWVVPKSIIMGPGSAMYLTGYFKDTADLNPGAGVAQLISNGIEDVFVVKLDRNCNYNWAKSWGGVDNDLPGSVNVDPSGNVITSGSFAYTVDFDPGTGTDLRTSKGLDDVFFVKLNSNGDYVWAKTINSANSINNRLSAIDKWGNHYLTGNFSGAVDFDPGAKQRLLKSTVSSTFFAKYDVDGNFLWAKNNDATFVRGITISKIDNSLLLAGNFGSKSDFNPSAYDTAYLTSTSQLDMYFAKYSQKGIYGYVYNDVNGNCVEDAQEVPMSQRIITFNPGGISTLTETDGYWHFDSVSNGNYTITVDTGQFWSPTCAASRNVTVTNADSLTKTDDFALKAKFGLLRLSVYNDLNFNCQRDTLEVGIKKRKAIIQPGDYVVVTDSFGNVVNDTLSPGNYTVTFDTLGKWTTACPSSSINVILKPYSPLDTAHLFGIKSTQPCSDPNVSVHTFRLRRCLSDTKIFVNASNSDNATGSIDSTYVILELDSLITIDSSTMPYTLVDTNSFQFYTGKLNPGQSKQIVISASVSCKAVLEQTLCMRAKIFPVEPCTVDTVQPRICPDASTTCNTGFDGSNVVVKSRCINDSVYLSVKNENPTGNNNMSCPLPVNIFRDGVLIQTTQVQLNGGDSIIYKFPGDGRTWRIGSTQHPKHPRQGCPNSTIEACGDSTNWTPGLVNILPVNEVQDIEATYCGIVTGSYDPNDKTGFPLGVTANHFIAPNQQMEYLIRFQNTGNDTAFTVVIRDTLDTDFDIFTVRSGVASHAYDFRMYGQRILEWTFNNILLPDSATNEPASNGFVKFTVQQNKDLPDGTEFNNRVGIYFDFNDPIITNTTSHIINRPTFTVVVSGASLLEASFRIVAYPNPTSGWLTLKGLSGVQSHYTLRIKNLMGAEVLHRIEGSEDEAAFNLSTLPNGIYFIELAHANGKEALRVVKQ